jgi:PAS domain S-box-containing protein
MRDEDKTQSQLIDELRLMRSRLDELEGVESDCSPALDAYREGERRLLESAAEVSFEGIVFILDGKITYVNETFARMTGYTRSELVGTNFLELLAPESVSVLKGHLDNNIEEACELLGIRRNGATLPLEIHSKLVPYSGKMIRAAAVRDISDRKRSAEALETANRQLMSIIDFLPDATFVIDQQGKVIAWNRAIEAMTGIRKEDILGKGENAYAIAFYGKPNPMLIDMVVKGCTEHADSYDFVESEEGQVCAEVFVPNLYKGKGAYIWGTASPIYGLDGDILGAIESIRDVSKRKAMESALRQREKALEDKTRELQEMNAALNVLLQKRLEDQQELQERVLSNLREMILPYLEKLKQSRLNENQRSSILVLESRLHEVLSPFLKNVSTKLANLTPMEIQVASLVKDGRTSKEIARLLGVAQKTVSAHRYNLRTKLGLKNQKANLRSHLLSLH